MELVFAMIHLVGGQNYGNDKPGKSKKDQLFGTGRGGSVRFALPLGVGASYVADAAVNFSGGNCKNEVNKKGKLS